MASFSLAELQAALAQNAARWQAAETNLSRLAEADRYSRLGAVPPGGTQELLDREQRGRANEAGAGAIARSVGAPASFDWRSFGGNSYLTPIKDQGGCGSCVAFGTVATIEAMVKITRNDPKFAVDLSEAQLFYCYGAQAGRNCENGWWPDGSFASAQNGGLVDDACFPYTAHDQACNLCADWKNRLTWITSWHQVSSIADMKTWIANRGPLSTCFTVYDDFFSYTGGVYQHVKGNVAGGHCVSVVGYDDVHGCWIAKNSWGPGFGESGYFRIAYGQCGFDSEMWAADGIMMTGWERGTSIIGLWSIDQDENAWAYVRAADGSNLGWRRIAPDNDNIFVDMLSELIAAKAAARPVDFYEEQGVIKQVYAW